MAFANVQCILHNQWERYSDSKRINSAQIDDCTLPFEDLEVFCGNCPSTLQIHFFHPLTSLRYTSSRVEPISVMNCTCPPAASIAFKIAGFSFSGSLTSMTRLLSVISET